jgi:DNA-binding transcriptional ArsR family regulator
MAGATIRKMEEVMDDPLQPEHCAEMLSALASPERLRIVRFLRDGPRNVTEIAEMLQAPAVNVSHHVTVLRRAGILRSRKQGRFILYSLAPGICQLKKKDHYRLNLGCCGLDLPAEGPDSEESAD